MAKSLVVYYSRKGENHMPGGIQVLEKGNTEYAAEHIAKAVGADLFEIDTQTPYAAAIRQRIATTSLPAGQRSRCKTRRIFLPAVIASQCAHWCGNPFSKSRFTCFYKCGSSETLHLGYLSV